MSAGIDVNGSGDIIYPFQTGNLYAAQTLTSANGTTPVTIITGSPGYYITDMGMQVDPLSTTSGGATISCTFTDTSSGVMFNGLWFLPASAAPHNTVENQRIVTGPGFIWRSKVANSSLQVSVSAALTAGSVRFFVRYGLSSKLG